MKRFSIAYFLFVLVGLILIGVVWLALPMQVLGQPEIPHRIDDREDCLSCHETGGPGTPQMPEDHDWHTNNSCKKCHDPVAEYAPLTPHKLVGREDCTVCHVPEAAAAELAAEAAVLAGPLPTPIAFPEPEEDVDNCVDCHLAEGGQSAELVNEWQSGVHFESDVLCASCHGGDPTLEDMHDAKSPENGYIGIPERTEIPELCGSCHSDVNLMRQYDLPTDQLAKYRESFHGQQLAEGDMKVAVCSDCHGGGHGIRESRDPQSTVYRFNVPELCASCHADEAYMAEYEIPTNQFALYQESVHGIALLEHQDTRAPNCATCHGTHGAAPPGFAEVANVCGSCHDATQDYYAVSAHFSTDPDTPRCVTCHGRYDVQPASEAMFVGNGPRECGSCHEPDSEIGETVTEIHQALVNADQALTDAQAAVDRAAELGMIVNEQDVLLTEAFTSLVTARAAQHTVDLGRVLEETDAAIELSETARQQAEKDIEENRFRRQAMVIALAVIGLTIVALVLLRRELILARSNERSTDDTTQ